jgi:hypothetical protein
MRKVIFFLAAVLFTVTVTAQDKEKDKDKNKDKQAKETIEGNGKSVTRDVTVSSFDAMNVSGVFELRLSQGSRESVKIEADENLQEYFSVRNEGNKLVIDTKKLENKNLKSKNKMRVYVTFRELKDVQLNTVGDVNSEEKLSFGNLKLQSESVGSIDLELTAKKLDMKITSVGDITLRGKADDAVVKSNGVGSLQAGKFVVQTMNIENTGVGEAEVNAEKDLKVKDTFLGKVTNKGKAPVRKMNRVRV